MEHWKREFLSQLKQGVPPDKACRSAAGMPLSQVMQAREDDPNFAYAWDAIAPLEEPKGPSRELTAASLEDLLLAQVSDAQAAAYFSMTDKEFTEAIKKPHLKRVYDTARQAGLALLQTAQFKEAISGDRQMLTWLGKQHLGQADKAENKVVHEVEVDLAELGRRMKYLIDEADEAAGRIIDLIPVEVAG